MTTSKLIIEKAIEARAEIAQAEEKKRLEQLQAQADQLFLSLKESMGEYWILVEETGAKARPEFDRGVVHHLELTLSDLSAFELSPIYISWGGQTYYNSNPFRAAGSSFPDISSAIFAARQNFPKWKEEINESALKPLYKKLRYSYEGVQTQEEALIVEKQILEIDGSPEQRERVEKALKDWNNTRLQYEARLKREAEEHAERERVEAQYLRALVDWMRERDRIESKNENYAEAIQTVSDGKYYTVYKLTYGIVAFDEEGEKYLETRFVWTQSELPASDGFWMVKGNPFRPFHPVSIEIFNFKPSDGPISKSFSKAGYTLYFAPNVKDSKIRDLRDRLQELPEKPAEPEGYYFPEATQEARAILALELKGEQAPKPAEPAN